MKHSLNCPTFHQSWPQSRDGMYVLLIALTGLAFAILKLNGVSVESTLWAEDGKIFMQEANVLGLSSIWTPYAGYLHVYPRLVALFSTAFHPSFTPLIFFIGWLAAFTSFAYIVGRKCQLIGISLWSAVFTLLLLVAHPHQGEVFFNLTNAQWFIGAALAIYVLIPQADNAPLYEKGLILIAAITGPFALLLLPAQLLQLVVYQDWRQRKNIYVIMAIGALVQLFIILYSGRATQSQVDNNPSHWLQLAYLFFTFGNTSVFSQLAALGFWWATIQAWSHSKWEVMSTQLHYHNRTLTSLILLFAAIVFCIANLVAIKGIPDKISPMADGARYFFIPYILILLSTLTLTYDVEKIGKYARLSLATLAFLSFSAFHASNMQFKSFVYFAQVHPDLSIPIRPERQWNIHLIQKRKPFPELNPISLTIPPTSSRQNLDENSQSYILFNIENQCPSAKHIGLTIEMTLKTELYISLGWGEPGQFKSENTLTRIYPAGKVTVEFALPTGNKSLKNLSFKTSSPPASYTLHDAKLYCLYPKD